MKKHFCLLLCLTMMIGCFRQYVFAASTKVVFNKSELIFEMPILNVGSIVYHPLRELVESIGGEVQWDDETKVATCILNNTIIEFPIGERFYYINGEESKMNAAAFIDSGRTYIPIRYACEGLGFDVSFNIIEDSILVIYVDDTEIIGEAA